MIESKLLRDRANLSNLNNPPELDSITNKSNSTSYSGKQTAWLANHYQGYLFSSYKTYLDESLKP